MYHMLKISSQEIRDRLHFDNTWWDTATIESRYKAYPKRSYFEPFYDLATNSEVHRAVILMGPRRVGKTVIVYQAIERLITNKITPDKILYVSLDTPIYTGLSLEKILKFFLNEFEHTRSENLYIFFDEIQYLKNWEVHLKSLVDSFPSYQFIATGSAAAALKLKSKESGAGRFTDFLLPPLTFSEYIYFIGKDEILIDATASIDTPSGIAYKAKNINDLNNEFINYLNYGGYPEAVFSDQIQADSARYIKSDIIDKVLLRDLPSLYGIQDVPELNRLFTTLAYNTGNEVSLESLTKISGVAKNTLKKYLDYLEAAFLIKMVKRIDQNAKKFKRATNFKVYLTNPSMRAALFGPIREDSNAIGALTETAIYSQWLHSATINNLYYARWKDGEIDIVHLDNQEQMPDWCIEVKWSDLVFSDNRKIKSVIKFISANKIISSPLVTTKTVTGEKIVNNVNIEYLPSSEYAYILGKNILRLRSFQKN